MRDRPHCLANVAPPPPPDLQLVVSAKAGKGGVKDVTAKLLVTHEFEI